LWTTITKKGQEKRLKLLELSLTDGKLSIESVQIEGGLPQSPDDLL
jgi:hypothetical protein